MANLIGTESNQIPLNAHLGSAAYINAEQLPVSDPQQNALDNKVSKVVSTDNAIARFDGTTGSVQNSGISVTDDNHLRIPSSSGGIVEIAAPVTASNYVLTAPATSSTIDTLARTGNVLQVVNATYSTQVGSTSLTPSDTGLTATITPTSSSSKILVIVNQSGLYKDGAAAQGGDLFLVRNSSTTLAKMADRYAGDSGASFNLSIGGTSYTHYDSPATTSPVTYKTTFNTRNAGSLVYVQVYYATSSITLMEIAG